MNNVKEILMFSTSVLTLFLNRSSISSGFLFSRQQKDEKKNSKNEGEKEEKEGVTFDLI